MEKEKYLRLLEKSISFQKMDAERQNFFKAAEGEKIDHYAQVFEEEAEILAKAYDKLQTDTDEVLKGFKREAIHDVKVKIDRKEAKEYDQELSKIEAKLNNI